MAEEADSRKCPLCGGETAVGELRATYRTRLMGGSSWVPSKEGKGMIQRIFGSPPEEFPVRARRCMACGHVELFTEVR